MKKIANPRLRALAAQYRARHRATETDALTAVTDEHCFIKPSGFEGQNISSFADANLLWTWTPLLHELRDVSGHGWVIDLRSPMTYGFLSTGISGPGAPFLLLCPNDTPHISLPFEMADTVSLYSCAGFGKEFVFVDSLELPLSSPGKTQVELVATWVNATARVVSPYPSI